LEIQREKVEMRDFENAATQRKQIERRFTNVPLSNPSTPQLPRRLGTQKKAICNASVSINTCEGTKLRWFVGYRYESSVYSMFIQMDVEFQDDSVGGLLLISLISGGDSRFCTLRVTLIP
jgi:hypothetical protein